MSNNRGNITLAKTIALKDIAKYMKDKLKESWCGGMLRENGVIAKLNKKLGI